MPIQFEVDFNEGVITVDLEDVENQPLVHWKLHIVGCYDIQLPPLGPDPPP